MTGYAALIGAVPDHDGEGPVLAMPFAEQVVGRPGFLHGGAIGGLLELAALATLREALADQPGRVALVTMTVDYRRGGRERTTRAAARVTRLGRRVAAIEASAWQEARDRPIATARLTFAIERD